jgi:tetratricopeptide (TPR) repeat protein
MNSIAQTVVRTLFLTGLLACAHSALAQQITGRVVYSENGQAAFNVPVRCVGTDANFQIVTDRSGRFVCNVHAGHYDVSVEAPGYRREAQSVDILDGNANEFMIFRLKAEPSAAKPAGNLSDPNAIPVKAREAFDQGAAIINEGKKEWMPQGIAFLEKAISLYPPYLQAHLMLGATYMDLKQWDKAEQALKRALEIDPKAANAMFALGELYLRQKKYDQAEKILQDGIAVEARSAQAHIALARVYWERVFGVKDEEQWRAPLEKAYEEVKQALALDPDLAAAHLLKGNLLFKVHRAEDALHEFDEYLRLDPKGEFAVQTRALADKIRKALAETKKQ